MHDRTIAEDLLVGTIYDWIDLGSVRAAVREFGGGAAGDLFADSMALVSELVEGGLVTAGDVVDGRFRTWNCTRHEAVARVDAEWRALDDPDAVWPFVIAALAVTPAGLDVVATVLGREGDDEPWRDRALRHSVDAPHPMTRDRMSHGGAD